jgi:protein PhnA|tara:strand:- start:5027 stop:5608 length:582 start_codon:yes stop_codon:yes gene_type:complete
MEIEQELQKRSGYKCELCTATNDLIVYEVNPTSNRGGYENIMTCKTCNDQLTNPATADSNHWRCLNESMWSEVDAVKVVAYRMLSKLASEGWPQDLLDMIYLEGDALAWAKKGLLDESVAKIVIHKDSNGNTLTDGDAVVLTQDLNVKGGGNFTAKRGTAVKNIKLDPNNAEYIEGRVEGQYIVILTKYVKKS